ncbi:MAG: hypothetical protein AAF281_08480, partial [Pseudomonadota bacterium]
MQAGLAISGTLHAAFLAVALIGLPWSQSKPEPVDQVISVTLERVEEAPPPTAPAPAPDIAMTDMAALSVPEFDQAAIDAPDAETVPDVAVTDEVEAPSEQDQAADLTALLETLAQPEVAVEVDGLDAVAEAAPDVGAALAQPPSPGGPSTGLAPPPLAA